MFDNWMKSGVRGRSWTSSVGRKKGAKSRSEMLLLSHNLNGRLKKGMATKIVRKKCKQAFIHLQHSSFVFFRMLVLLFVLLPAALCNTNAVFSFGGVVSKTSK